MTVSDRNQFERADQVERSHRPRTRLGRRATIAYTLIALAVLAVLTFAAFQVFDGGHHWIIIANLVILLFGVAAWVNPKRRHV